MPGFLFLRELVTNAPRLAAGDGPGCAHGRPRPDLDEVFLDALKAVVLAALEWIGHDPDARFRFFRQRLAVAEEEAVSRRWS